MADMTFKRNAGILIWQGRGRWEAKSGPFDQGRLPLGLYKVSRREVTAYTANVPSGFKDPATGKGFFIPIYPQFSTHRGKSGGRLGIHPDGNSPGTKGCIGIRSNAKSFHDAIAKSAADSNLMLEVLE